MSNKKRQFTVISGIHCENGKVYKAGESLVTERDLCALYPGKFTAVSTPVFVDNTEPEGKALAVMDAASFNPAGLKDVTSNYAEAEKAKFRVYLNKETKGYFIVNAGGKLLNANPLKKPELAEFIADNV